MIRYPSGIKKPTKKTSQPRLTKLAMNTYKNRGMDFEKEINLSNAYYLETKQAVITKRPTPINVVKVDYQRGAKITHAYFEKQSTTDYNGIYRGKYVDFEAKSTQSKTALAIANITIHQREHLARIIAQGGIAFILISFPTKQEIFALKAADFLQFIAKEKRQSLPYVWIAKVGEKVTIGLHPRIDYLPAIDALFF
ncbi:MAG: Holliday junction resolvase RecU [Bacilli bacterium]